MTQIDYRDFSQQIEEANKYQSIISRAGFLEDWVKSDKFDTAGFIKKAEKEIAEHVARKAAYGDDTDGLYHYYKLLAQLENKIKYVKGEFDE